MSEFSNYSKIIHIDMDAFFAAVEIRDNPDLINKPVAIGGFERGVVSTANYIARRFGVKSAIPSFKANQLCPDLIWIKPNFDKYKAVSSQIKEIFLKYTDLVEMASLDEGYLDVTKNKFGIESATKIAFLIKQEIFKNTGLTASAGISFNKFLAKVASDYRKPDGLTLVDPGHAQKFVDNLEVRKFPGIGNVTAQKMYKLEIRYGLDIKSKDLSWLKSKFGKVGLYYYNMARCQDSRLVNPNRIRKSVGIERTYAQSFEGVQIMESKLGELAIGLENRLTKTGKKGRTLVLKIKFKDFTQITRSKTLDFSFSDLEQIQKITKILIQNNFPQKPIRLLGLSINNLD